MSHSKPTSICFPAIAGLVLFLVVVSSTAPQVNKRQAVNVESDRNITKQIFIGTVLLNNLIDNATVQKTKDQLKSVSVLILTQCMNNYCSSSIIMYS